MGSPSISTGCASPAEFTLSTSIFSSTFGTFVGRKYPRVSPTTPRRGPAGNRRARRSLSGFGSAKDPREEAPAFFQLFHGAALERRGQPKHAGHQHDRGGAQERAKALRAGSLIWRLGRGLGPRLYGRCAPEEDVLYAGQGRIDVALGLLQAPEPPRGDRHAHRQGAYSLEARPGLVQHAPALAPVGDACHAGVEGHEPEERPAQVDAKPHLVQRADGRRSLPHGVPSFLWVGSLGAPPWPPPNLNYGLRRLGSTPTRAANTVMRMSPDDLREEDVKGFRSASVTGPP